MNLLRALDGVVQFLEDQRVPWLTRDVDVVVMMPVVATEDGIPVDVSLGIPGYEAVSVPSLELPKRAKEFSGRHDEERRPVFVATASPMSLRGVGSSTSPTFSIVSAASSSRERLGRREARAPCSLPSPYGQFVTGISGGSGGK